MRSQVFPGTFWSSAVPSNDMEWILGPESSWYHWPFSFRILLLFILSVTRLPINNQMYTRFEVMRRFSMFQSVKIELNYYMHTQCRRERCRHTREYF